MNIGIKVNRHEFLYDIHSLVKSFFPDDEVSIFTEDDAEKCSLERDLLLNVDVPDPDPETNCKNALKRELYGTLSEYTGTVLPWGTLSGIRPTKIPMKLLREGKSKEEILRYLKEEYLVSDEKAELAFDVAKNELRLTGDLNLDENSYSIYFHVPFCPSICLYCTFSSSPISVWAKKADEYVDAMILEMKERHKAILAEGKAKCPTTVYIGGGTPTTLTAEQLDRLLTAIEATWDLTDTREFTVEAGRPDSLTMDKLKVLKAHKVTRISVNPQTMNDDTLDYIGRHHTSDDTRNAFAMAREAGFDNINMDMILGLPGEEEPHVRYTLDEIMKMNPDSLTVHSLAVKRASRLNAKIREDRELNRDADYGNYDGLVFENSGTLMDLATDAARSMNMEPYYLYRQKNMRGNLENTGFARTGCECLYNILIMEEMQSIYAFGAGASTKYVYADGKIERKISPKDVKTYLERLYEKYCDGTDS